MSADDFMYRMFETVPVVENEVIDKIALNFCHAAADDAGQSVLKKRPIQNSLVGISYRDQYSERSPAVPGEQVSDIHSFIHSFIHSLL